jgi:iron(III) transport system substrate-binding protein
MNPNPTTGASGKGAGPVTPKADPPPARRVGLLTWVWVGAVIALAIAAMQWGKGRGPAAEAGEVVVYAAQDQVYAEPILREFTRQTGIKVRPVFDSEAVKTVGLANRLLAETNRPQADVFWGNEELRTRQLAVRGVLRSTNGWAGFGFRSRRVVVNTNQAPGLNATTEFYLRALTNQAWRGKIALAYPMFGTTAAQMHALRQHWGPAAWEQWCRALQANRPLLVDGNSVVVDLVGRGEAWIGLTDADDILAGQKRRLPIIALPITEETLLMPNTVGVVRGAPNAAPAEKLFQYLQSAGVLDGLVDSDALEGARPGLRPHLKVDWDGLLRDLDDTNERLKTIFLR